MICSRMACQHILPLVSPDIYHPERFKRICELMFTNCFNIPGLKGHIRKKRPCWNLEAVQKFSLASLMVCFQHLFNLLLLSRNPESALRKLISKEMEKMYIVLSVLLRLLDGKESVFYN